MTTTTTTHTTRLLSTALLGAALLCGPGAATAEDTYQAPADTASGSAAKAERAVSDSWITTKVKSEILANSLSKGFKVGVTTKQGVVKLDGKLPNQDAIDLVKKIAEQVKGVKSVDTSALVVG